MNKYQEIKKILKNTPSNNYNKPKKEIGLLLKIA